jgi:hypothetical protein
VLRHIRQMARQASADSQSDAQLLEAFLAHRDEEANAQPPFEPEFASKPGCFAWPLPPCFYGLRSRA